MKKNSIEKTLPRLARLMILLLIILIIPANLGLQQYLQHQSQKDSAEEIFSQLEQVIETNEKIWKKKKKNFPRNVFSLRKWLHIMWNIILPRQAALPRQESLRKNWM